MGKLSNKKESIAAAWRADININKVRGWSGSFSRRGPAVAADYVTNKVPFVKWLPRYDPKWLLQDFISGITIGALFIPEGLSYAKLATIPVAYGLYSSWLPSLLYLFLGTSKDLSSGPTSMLGLLTASAVSALSKEGYEPAHIASALAFLIGIYSLALGLLNFGFLLDFVSGPVLTGWVTAVAVVMVMGQIPSLVGVDVGSAPFEVLIGVFGHPQKIQLWSVGITVSSFIMLFALQYVGTRWGKNQWIKLIGTSRALIVLVVFTSISYLVNHGRDEQHYKWEVTEVNTHGLVAPRMHDGKLLQKAISYSFAPFIAMTVEHLGVGKAFSLRGGYHFDKSQELCFLGINNMVNSLFGGMATGGDISRSAVCESTESRSPLNFLFTSSFVLLTIYAISPALYWIPKATLAAIIVNAVLNLVSGVSVFYRFWRISFLDFACAGIAYFITFAISTEVGLEVAVGLSVAITLLRLAFPRSTLSKNYLDSGDVSVPEEAYLVRFTSDIIYCNAERLRARICDDIMARYDPPTEITLDSKNRIWSDSTHQRICKIRRRENITPASTPLRHVVLDFSMVNFIDVSGILSLMELKMELRKYFGQHLQFRLFGLIDPVLERLKRSEWELAREGEERTKNHDVLYSSLGVAVLHRDTDDEKTKLVSELECVRVA